MRPSVTQMASAKQFKKRNIIVLQSINMANLLTEMLYRKFNLSLLRRHIVNQSFLEFCRVCTCHSTVLLAQLVICNNCLYVYTYKRLSCQSLTNDLAFLLWFEVELKHPICRAQERYSWLVVVKELMQLLRSVQ